jgi:XTP/dITP diphosphohydrolase
LRERPQLRRETGGIAADGTIRNGSATTMIDRSSRPRILVGTTNPHKVVELGALLDGLGCQLVLPTDAGLEGFDVDETGDTLMANAILKAMAFAARAGMPALADDSGLEVDALGGEPGVRSRRYAGDDASDADRIALVLSKLDGVPVGSRTARFRSVIALAEPGRLVGTGTGTVDGVIGDMARGTNGFGYDPIFLMGDRSMAELTPAEKNATSHRSRAVASIRPILEAWPCAQGHVGDDAMPPRT